MLTIMVWTMLVAGSPANKLPPATGKEMREVIIAINKALGLESWVVPGEPPCVDRGGLEATIKDVTPEQTRTCATTAISQGFEGLGKDYTVGIPMAGIGPVTVFAIGHGDADGWGAYSCDPTRKCNPTKLSATSKQAKRLAERYRKACQDPRTVWFPNRESVCEGSAMDATPEPTKSPSTPAPPSKPAPSKPSPSGGSSTSPWPVKE
jgi:hypothetical protein